MIDFLKFNDDISDEMLAAYIDGNATDEESVKIKDALSSNEMLSEVADVLNDIKSYDDSVDWGIVEVDDESLSIDFPLNSQYDELMVASAIQEPPEISIELPPLEFEPPFEDDPLELEEEPPEELPDPEPDPEPVLELPAVVATEFE